MLWRTSLSAQALPRTVSTTPAQATHHAYGSLSSFS
jgi:hypothetical protein